jgi:hypothetical protein
MEVCDSASGTKHGANIAAGGSSSKRCSEEGQLFPLPLIAFIHTGQSTIEVNTFDDHVRAQ